jgi:RNA polymerase sigma factor for flagellar operon FliA
MSSNIPSRLVGYKTTARAGLDIDITQYAPLVRKIASILISRLPASVELDDLIQVGIIGLIDAARQFDPSQGVQFETFASQRVRGAMLDELRREDWMPRQTRRHAKQIEEAITQLEQRNGRSPLESEIAEQLNLSLTDYQTLLGECKGLSLLHIEDFTNEDGESINGIANMVDHGTPDPLASLSDGAFKQALVHSIGALPERDQLVMALYYEQDLNLKEIGAVLGVSESRVSQLHSQAIARLRVKMKDWL